MKNWYVTFSVVVFNTLIVSLLFLIGLWGVLEVRHLVSGRGSVVISDAIQFQSFGLTPIDRAKETAKEFDAYASQQPFVFNPWTTFMIAPVSGKNLNVAADPILNHRLNGPIPPNEQRQTRPLVIWCFGGSTLYGFGVPDDQTIPSHVRRRLVELYPNRAVDVVNFGQPYWFSSVEVAGYLALLRSGRRPDLVLFLDGLNDMANLVAGRVSPFFANRARSAWERERSDARRLLPWLTVNESFPITRVLRYVQSKFPSTANANEATERLEPLGSGAIASIMENNRKIVTAINAEFGIQTLFFLQPVPWYGEYKEKRINRSFPFGNGQVAVRVYDRLVEEYRKAPNAMPLHDLLYAAEWPFVDDFHYSDTSNKIIAEQIAKRIAESEIGN